MDDLIRVLLVDDNKGLCKLIEEKLNSTGGIKTIGIAGDGVTAVNMIRELEPDFVLLDVIMPNLDGLGVLEHLATEKTARRPLVIVFTAIGGDTVVQRALELGADYYMMKPVDTDILVSRITQIFDENRNTDDYYCSSAYGSGEIYSAVSRLPASRRMEQIISDLIRGMGVTPNLAGYNYLREAVMLAVEKPEVLKSVSGIIYPQLALSHNTNARNIDRAIRCAIDSAQKKTKNVANSVQDEYMALSGKKRSNSARIISFLADKATQTRNIELKL